MEPDHAGRPSQKKKRRVRSAWISFVGRIVAQIIGAAATILLGIAMVQRSSLPRSASAATRTASLLPRAVQPARQTDGRPSLLILPLNSATSDARLMSIADGLTEAVTVDVAQLATFRVVSRTSSAAYTAQQKPLSVIADELDVDFVIEGSVVSEADHVRVTARLIDARKDEHLWARVYDHSTVDVMALQREVGSAIAREVENTVPSGESHTGKTGD